MPRDYFARVQQIAAAACGKSFVYSGLSLRLETKRLEMGDPGYTPEGAGNANESDQRSIVFSADDLAKITRAAKPRPAPGRPITFDGRPYRLDAASPADGGALRCVAVRRPANDDPDDLTAQDAEWPAPPTQ